MRAPAADEERRREGRLRVREGKVVEVEKEKERVLGVVRRGLVEESEDLGWNAIEVLWRAAIGVKSGTFWLSLCLSICFFLVENGSFLILVIDGERRNRLG